MCMAATPYHDVLAAARKLPIEEQAHLIADLSSSLDKKLEARAVGAGPRESLYGSLAHLGPAPSAEDIDEVRREMWANFGQDDV